MATLISSMPSPKSGQNDSFYFEANSRKCYYLYILYRLLISLCLMYNGFTDVFVSIELSCISEMKAFW